MEKAKKWKENRDPLFRGDAQECVSLPTPDADPSIVRHILYLDGPGRETPYLSTTESDHVAERFAGNDGQVRQTWVRSARENGIRHIGRSELRNILKGSGKGTAKWHSAFEVMQARRYVEEWLEHLFDFRPIHDLSLNELRQMVDSVFEKASS
ncbi:MAG: hypothetical protein GY856_09025 [bacterium]|nr:hypothetical protein [bacterium]